MKCENCKGDLYIDTNEKHKVVVGCKTCKVEIDEDEKGGKWESEELEAVLSGAGAYKELYSTAKKKPYNAWVFFDFKKKWTRLDFKKLAPGASTFPCQCDGVVGDKGKSWACNKCNAVVFKNFHGKNRTEEEVKKLFANEEVTLTTAWEGTDGKDKTFKIDFKTGKVVVVSAATPQKEANFNCKCGGKIRDFENGMACKECESLVWKNVNDFDRSDEIIKKLFAGEIVVHQSNFQGQDPEDKAFRLDFETKKVIVTDEKVAEESAAKEESIESLKAELEAENDEQDAEASSYEDSEDNEVTFPDDEDDEDNEKVVSNNTTPFDDGGAK